MADGESGLSSANGSIVGPFLKASLLGIVCVCVCVCLYPRELGLDSFKLT